jgi:hypothetical protein
MIRVIPWPKEDQDEKEEVSLLSRAFHTESQGGQTAEDLRGAAVPKGVEQGQQRPMETTES